MSADLPMSVWATAQTHIRQQRAGRYVRESANHPGRMLPAIARAAISAYTSRGDLVLDPMCGVGTTLVEAIHLGRHAVGVEYEPVWADIARANLEFAAAQGAIGRGEVITGDALRPSELVDREICGTVGMVLTSPPCGASVHGQATPGPGRGVIRSHHRYSKDRTNLAHQPLGSLLSAFASILAACRDLLRSGGVVAVTARRSPAAGDRPRGRACVPSPGGGVTRERPPPSGPGPDGSGARDPTSEGGRADSLQLRIRVRYAGGEAGRVLAVAQGRALREALEVLREVEVGQAEEQ